MCQSTAMAHPEQQQPVASSSNSDSERSWREQGNAAFKQGQGGEPGAYLRAAALYTRALKVEPSSEVLYSNRSAALLQINKVTKALADAEECVRLAPQWDKGHYRRAQCLEALERWEEALLAYQAAAERSKDSKAVADKIRGLKRQLQKQKAAAAHQPAEAAEAGFQPNGGVEASSGNRSSFKF